MFKNRSFNHLTNVLDDFYSIVEIAGYASEFQNQDKFAVKSLDTFIKNSNYGSVMSTAMKDGLSDYKNILETVWVICLKMPSIFLLHYLIQNQTYIC